LVVSVAAFVALMLITEKSNEVLTGAFAPIAASKSVASGICKLIAPAGFERIMPVRTSAAVSVTAVDRVTIASGTHRGVYLVAMVLEQWNDWVKVAATLQNGS